MMDIINSKHWLEWLITIAKFAFAFVPIGFILLLIPLERRGAGFIQDRQGPNRSYFKIPYFGRIRLFGWVQNACDGLKLFLRKFILQTAFISSFLRLLPRFRLRSFLFLPV